MSSEEERIPRKASKQKNKKERHAPIKRARDKAARRKKEQAFLADTSDEDDEFAGN